MHLVVIGLNYKSAPVEVRESLAVSEPHIQHAHASLCGHQGVLECCILSTCNRTEIYAVTTNRADEESVIGFLSTFHKIDRTDFEHCLYVHRGHKAVEHLFNVSAGLDSMMLGEYQILGQIKNAYCAAGEADTTKTVLNTLIKQAISVGKRARTETEISRGAFSIGYAAVELAKLIFSGLQGKTVLVIGAGKMSEFAAKHLVSAGANSVIVTNRTLSRAEELAAAFGGEAIPFDAMPTALERSDIVISSTGSSEPIITRDQMAKIMRIRRARPVFIVDIAVPRDFDPEIGNLDNVFLYNIDDLVGLVQQSVSERESEVEKVRSIVADETQKFMSWTKTLEAVPLIKQYRQRLEDLRDTEWERNRSKLAHLSEEDQESMLAMMQSLINRISHNPLVAMKEYASNSDEKYKLDIARELLGIDFDDADKENNL